MPGYHIPHAEVRLLSPQTLLSNCDPSTAIGYIRTADLTLCLGNGIELQSEYCPRSNLPLLKVCKDTPEQRILWHDAFSRQMHSYSASTNVLDSDNVNLSAAEKELLLWHNHLSHASVSWLQPLMRTKKWLKDHTSPACLHQGPFLHCRQERTTSCSTTGVRCAGCLAAKASTRSAGARHESHDTPTQSQLEKLTRRVNGERAKKLKQGDLERGNCVLCDHYMSAVEGRLEHSFGREKQGYTCGTLFVDHATGKIFNFCQILNNATETVISKCKLEYLASSEGFKIKKYHTNNGTFASEEF